MDDSQHLNEPAALAAIWAEQVVSSSRRRSESVVVRYKVRRKAIRSAFSAAVKPIAKRVS